MRTLPPGRATGSAIAALALATGSVLSPAPAGAVTDGGGEYDVPATQALAWPLPLGTTVVLDGPANVWQMRTFAEEVDAALPGVEIVTGPAADHPGAFVVTIDKAHRPKDEFAGFTDWLPPASPSAYPTGATITLNTHFQDSPRATRRQVAAHELMHVLGFRHHEGDGIAGAHPPLTLVPTPSPEEWTALHAYYG